MSPNVNTFKNRLDEHWSTEHFLYDYTAAIPGHNRAEESSLIQRRSDYWGTPPTVRNILCTLHTKVFLLSGSSVINSIQQIRIPFLILGSPQNSISEEYIGEMHNDEALQQIKVFQH